MTLPEETSIHAVEITAIKVALKEIHKRCISMQSIENNRENHLIINQICDILAELQAHEKKRHNMQSICTYKN